MEEGRKYIEPAFTAEEWYEKGAKAYKDGKFAEACVHFNKATDLKPDYAEAYNDWGIALTDLIDYRADETLYPACYDKFRKATGINPQYAIAFYNWGNALFDEAEIFDDDKVYAESVEKYRQAAKLKPDDADIYYSWANALLALAEIRKDERLYRICFDKYSKAGELNTNEAEIFNNWAIALSNLAKLRGGDKDLYYQSFDKYKKALDIRPDYVKTYFNWGLDLFELAKLENDIHAYAKEIEEKLMKTYDLGARKAVYNLACLYSLLNERDHAFCWFEKLLMSTNISRDFIEIEPDYANLREDKRFMELLDKYRPLKIE